MGLFLLTPTTELAYPMCWKVMFRSKWGVVEDVQRECEFED